VPGPFLDPYLKNVDVRILPVETVLTRTEVAAIVQKYDPKAAHGKTKQTLVATK
jgi:hypothetical protein